MLNKKNISNVNFSTDDLYLQEEKDSKEIKYAI